MILTNCKSNQENYRTKLKRNDRELNSLQQNCSTVQIENRKQWQTSKLGKDLHSMYASQTRYVLQKRRNWNRELEVKPWIDLSISLHDDELLSSVLAVYFNCSVFQNDTNQLEGNTNSNERPWLHSPWGKINRTKVIKLKKRSLGAGGISMTAVLKACFQEKGTNLFFMTVKNTKIYKGLKIYKILVTL